ncbi:hypothetical protein FRC02_011098 [Tulasnella sp. 418]|nr:hypothetical protein FRC02_011098 [Tulasnella sp. 418]
MLRRDPTPIVLRDNDVQEIRNLMNERKKAIEDAQNSGGGPSAVPVSSTAEPVVAPEEAKRKREAMTRNERIGIP